MKTKLLIIIALTIISASAHATCSGKPIIPSDLNWRNMYPFTILGLEAVSGGGGSNPPQMSLGSPCSCVDAKGPFTGVAWLFWEPVSLVEVVDEYGCSPALGGTSLIHNPAASGTTKDNYAFKHTHTIPYPIFAALNLLQNPCLEGALSAALSVDLSEIDPTHANSAWANLLAPESILFANPVAYLSCSTDAIASTVYHPLDALFWCAGQQGLLYPLSGEQSFFQGATESNVLMAMKSMAKRARTGRLWSTTGPWAACGAVPTGVIVKSEHRIDPVYPFKHRGNPIKFGEMTETWTLQPKNVPTRENSVFAIWKGKQCCIRLTR